MGKPKKNKPVKNVFKIAGARSLKLKNKAKAVSIQLKKLNEVTRNKTAEVDGQLTNEIREQLLQKQETSKPNLVASKQEKQQDSENNSKDTLCDLNQMQI